jgi:hypothetical protein
MLNLPHLRSGCQQCLWGSRLTYHSGCGCATKTKREGRVGGRNLIITNLASQSMCGSGHTGTLVMSVCGFKRVQSQSVVSYVAELTHTRVLCKGVCRMSAGSQSWHVCLLLVGVACHSTHEWWWQVDAKGRRRPVVDMQSAVLGSHVCTSKAWCTSGHEGLD